MPTREHRPNIFTTERMGGAEKRALGARVVAAARDLTLLLEGLTPELYNDIAILTQYIKHNVYAAQRGVTLQEIRDGVDKLTAGVELIRAQKNLGNSGSSEMH